ncbi:structural maintenance of chromosomes protein 2-1 [Tanacetum coccineum]
MCLVLVDFLCIGGGGDGVGCGVVVVKVACGVVDVSEIVGKEVCPSLACHRWRLFVWELTVLVGGVVVDEVIGRRTLCSVSELVRCTDPVMLTLTVCPFGKTSDSFGVELEVEFWTCDGESVLREACPTRASFHDLLLLSSFIVYSVCLLLLPYSIQKKIEDRASSIKNAEDGADDLKTRIDELAKSLEGHEKEYEDGDKSLLNQLGNENTAQQIIENRDLRGIVTTIPLNRIKSKPVQPQVQKAAVELVGEGNAEVALVGYADEVKLCFDFICCYPLTSHLSQSYLYFRMQWNLCSVKLLSARQMLLQRGSVTFEGDLFHLGGLVTGGSVRRGGDQLRQLHAVGEAYSELFLHEKRLSEIEAKINALVPDHEKYNELKQQLEVKTFRLKQSQNTAEQNEHHKLSEIVKRINQELEEAKSALTEKQGFYEECVTKVANLEISVQDHANNEDGSLKTRAEKIEAVKKKIAGYEKEREKLIMKVEALKQEHVSLENQLVSLQNEISTLTSEVDLLKTKVTSLKDEHSQAQSEFNAANTKLVECDAQISCIRKEQEKLKDRIREKAFEQKRLESEVKRTEVEQKNCSLKVDKLINKHAWITSEKQFFGRSGSDYDFTSRDPHRARGQLENLEAQQADHEKRVNKKVMSMFEKTENDYNDLISKKNIIETDKSKIKLVIEEVDAKKKEILQATWVKVNSNFGSIFSTLLPGTMAKLVPPEGGSCFDGLEVRVALGGVWKQSLSELSGGQRSLLALSLILALLLFKPAPIYILDEVDAALDLSHTQNIGRMIKAHFPHSQFIVVSLKEGLFNNANILFRTKFVDGISTVQRTVATNQSR